MMYYACAHSTQVDIRGQLVGLFLSFHRVDPADWIQVIMCVIRHL